MVAVDSNRSKVFDLMDLDYDNFVHEAYALLLNRQPDDEGFAYYLEKIHCGVSKRRIILQLINSEESVILQSQNLNLKTSVQDWRQKTKSIMDLIRKVPQLFKRKKSILSSRENMLIELCNQVNICANNQAEVLASLNLLQATLSNKDASALEQQRRIEQMSRQARQVYSSLIQSMSNSRTICE